MGTNFVTPQQTNFSTLKSTYKTSPEKVIIAENVKKYHQIEGAFPLLDDTMLYLDIGDFGEGPQVEAIIYGMYVYPDDKDPEVRK